MAGEAAGAELAVATDAVLRLGEALCARLCHDIAGSLGALIGALDLARDENTSMAEEALGMANATARELACRLRLLRAAWAGTDTPLDLRTLAELAHGLPPRRLELDLSAMPPDSRFAPATGRVVLNLVLLAAEALPSGGTIWLEPTDDDLLVGVSGAHSAWPAGLGPALAGGAKIADPRELQAPLCVLLARAAGLPLSLLLPAGPAADGAAPLLLGLKARHGKP